LHLHLASATAVLTISKCIFSWNIYVKTERINVQADEY